MALRPPLFLIVNNILFKLTHQLSCRLIQEKIENKEERKWTKKKRNKERNKERMKDGKKDGMREGKKSGIKKQKQIRADRQTKIYTTLKFIVNNVGSMTKNKL